jgi:signal transduction histidine kinase
VAIMNGYSLTDFFQSIEVGNDTQLAILLNHHQPLVSDSGLEPNLDKLRNVIKTNAFNSALNNLTQLTQTNGVENLTLYAYKTIADLPISVAIVMNHEDIFGSWYQTRQNYLMFMGIFLGFTVTVLFFLYILGRKIKQVRKSEQTAILASQAKSDFLAKMSHELRTPLNAVIGFSDMLKAGYFGELTQAQIERINDINMCGNHLLGFINDILEFSKGDAGKMQLEVSPFYLSDVVNPVIRMMNQRAKVHEVTLINYTDKYVVQLHADIRKIKQVMINLLSNAVKFTPRSGTIKLSAGVSASGDFFCSVEDTGVGIPKEDIPKAMSVFEQVHQSDDFEGTGLGLPLCKMLVELHGGLFTLESEVGKGTKATFTLPKAAILSYKMSSHSKLEMA